MTILVQWLLEHTWIFYTACALGALIYLVRALAAHRERRLALFTLERETATARAIQAWAMVFVFVAIGVLVFVSATFILPGLPTYSLGTPLPTSTPRAGVEPVTPETTPTEPIVLPTFTPLTETTPAPTLPPPEPTKAPTPVATETGTPTPAIEGPISGELQVRFGDFAALVGYGLSATDISTSESLVLTLYWRGLEGTSPKDYVVFTHLLSEDGNLIAQHDGAPADGARPVTGWKAGEVIEDRHAMTFKSEFLDYAGPATVAVGLYDPSNPSARVQTQGGDDRVVLPTAIDVVP